MISLATARRLALAFEGVDEKPHLEKISFRVKNKIFATVDLKTNKVVLNFLKLINLYYQITTTRLFTRCLARGGDKVGQWLK